MKYKEKKITQAAALILELAAEDDIPIKLESLMWMLYAADRKSLITIGRPMSFDTYEATIVGPILVRTSQIAVVRAEGEYWNKQFAYDDSFFLTNDRRPESGQLSQHDEDILKRVYLMYGCYAVVDFLLYSEKWTEFEPQTPSVPITMQDIWRAGSWSEEDIEAVADEIKYLKFIDELFEGGT